MLESPYRAKYIFVLGGVMSGIGKGIVTSSIGMSLQARGLSINVCKVDPYLNFDAGTMNPFEHGETFVTDDGGELDVDFGHYERFLRIRVKKEQNITTGQIYYSVIEKERRGDYLGHTVQVVPHIIDEIKERIAQIDQMTRADVLLIEIGGTVGDIESQPFLEAVRQIIRERKKNDVILVHTTYVPFPPHINEPKTKPTQHSVRDLKAAGLDPDIIVARSERDIGESAKSKISLFCDVPENAVFTLPDLEDVLEAPLVMDKQGLGGIVIQSLGLDSSLTPDWTDLQALFDLKNKQDQEVLIGLTGKYTKLKDSYISVLEAFYHAGLHTKTRVKVEILDVEKFEQDPGTIHELSKYHGIIVPGGFGKRGTEGKIKVIQYCRENKIPFLGICLGFQLSAVEFARNVCGKSDAHSTEMDENTSFPIVDLQEEQKHVEKLGATMRLGAHEIVLQENSLIHNLYGKTKIYERHRHRYEINQKLSPLLEEHGLRFTGKSGIFYEALELPEHPFFLAVQFHPEFKSTPWDPSPPYLGLVRNARIYKEKR